MSEPTDHELLADYARTGAEPAFAQLVARHIHLVHSAARRYAGGEPQAEEITQAVFLILARKAGSLADGGLRRPVALGGWLYQTARHTAANAQKAETRRQLRDHQAYMQTQETQADDAVWREIAPLLDDAMGKLGETDRTVLVLRFFEGRTNAETAAALGLAEGAVQKRVLRALEKLRASFAKQGVTHTAQAIAGTVTTNAVMLAPVGLAAKVSLIAAKGAAATTAITSLVNGTLKLMTWVKYKLAVYSGATVVTIGVVTTVAISDYEADKYTGSTSSVFQIRKVFNTSSADSEDMTVLTTNINSGKVFQEKLHVQKTVLLDQTAIASATISTNAYFGQPIDILVDFTLTPRGKKQFAKITRENIGRRLAIIIGGRIISAPNIWAEITSGNGQVSGGFSFQEATRLATILNKPPVN